MCLGALWGAVLWPCHYLLKQAQICESCKPGASEQLAGQGHICLVILIFI